MTWITILQLVIAAGRSLLAYVDPKLNAVTAELASELSAALDSLQRVHNKAVSLADLESLRTTKTW